MLIFLANQEISQATVIGDQKSEVRGQKAENSYRLSDIGYQFFFELSAYKRAFNNDFAKIQTWDFCHTAISNSSEPSKKV